MNEIFQNHNEDTYIIGANSSIAEHLKNEREYTGKETVELHTCDLAGLISGPVKQLKDFQKKSQIRAVSKNVCIK